MKLLLSLRRVTLEFGLGRNLILLSPLGGLQTVSALGASADVGLWFSIQPRKAFHDGVLTVCRPVWGKLLIAAICR